MNQVPEILEGCEALTLNVDDTDWHVLNPLNFVDCVDLERSDWGDLPDGDRYLRIPAFRLDDEPPSLLFRIREQPYMVLTSEDSEDRTRGLRYRVEASGLRGFEFRQGDRRIDSDHDLK